MEWLPARRATDVAPYLVVKFGGPSPNEAASRIRVTLKPYSAALPV
jgi:hypothetical protein